MSNVLVPSIRVPAPIEQQDGELYREWRAGVEEAYEGIVPENVRFEVNVDWRVERVMSIQRARALDHPLWIIVGMLFSFAVAGGWMFTFGLW